ncbi:acetyl-CoA acetyltransferase [Paramagnetospirillum caucaseum]|uniref:Acetyl-CoA acetyltransferase n=1 Tax=Paramagnetospirillum caucaseum TaxID=1244869 RepID=M2ZRK0_9PROT|nr:acetyl-CoA C-acyltransferase [Paramagnetospirillum caucaseum]EME69962.1 acetyl-CoA acetyltransferase [Paramagnetospirillum caucaseum]
MANANDIVAISAVRTPMGAFGGSFKDIPAYDLGAVAIRTALERAGITGEQVDQAIYANCRQAGNGPNPSRTAAVRGGIALDRPVFTVNMACPSGMKAMMLAGLELASGGSKIIVAGGMESMSTMPYLLKNVRWEGFKLGDKTLSDSWSDTLDPLCGYGMGMTAENLVAKYSIGRQEQDDFALASQKKAAEAQAAGMFDSEIAPVTLAASRDRDETVVARDESIRPDTSLERLAKLKPVFKKDGSITAGNSCGMGDAAAALVLTTRGHAKSIGKAPLFSVVASAQIAVEPATMGDGPGWSIPLALTRAGMTLPDMDFIEVNEAFAAQMIANERVLGWDRARVNAFGGAIALGHPTGSTGARLMVTLDNILRKRDKELGIASICGGGGVTTAMIIRRES